jgi:hypothetical protein
MPSPRIDRVKSNQMKRPGKSQHIDRIFERAFYDYQKSAS